MVDSDVKKEVIRVMTERFPDTPAELLEYAFSCKVLDVNKCRIAIIKRHYQSLVDGGMTASDAYIVTGEKFCRSENTIRNIVYNEFYRDIRI